MAEVDSTSCRGFHSAPFCLFAASGAEYRWLVRKDRLLGTAVCLLMFTCILFYTHNVFVVLLVLTSSQLPAEDGQEKKMVNA